MIIQEFILKEFWGPGHILPVTYRLPFPLSPLGTLCPWKPLSTNYSSGSFVYYASVQFSLLFLFLFLEPGPRGTELNKTVSTLKELMV